MFSVMESPFAFYGVATFAATLGFIAGNHAVRSRSSTVTRDSSNDSCRPPSRQSSLASVYYDATSESDSSEIVLTSGEVHLKRKYEDDHYTTSDDSEKFLSHASKKRYTSPVHTSASDVVMTANSLDDDRDKCNHDLIRLERVLEDPFMDRKLVEDENYDELDEGDSLGSAERDATFLPLTKPNFPNAGPLALERKCEEENAEPSSDVHSIKRSRNPSPETPCANLPSQQVSESNPTIGILRLLLPTPPSNLVSVSAVDEDEYVFVSPAEEASNLLAKQQLVHAVAQAKTTTTPPSASFTLKPSKLFERFDNTRMGSNFRDHVTMSSNQPSTPPTIASPVSSSEHSTYPSVSVQSPQPTHQKPHFLKSSHGFEALAGATSPFPTRGSQPNVRTPSPSPPKVPDVGGFAAYSGSKSPFAFATDSVSSSRKTRSPILALPAALKLANVPLHDSAQTDTLRENSRGLECVPKADECHVQVFDTPSEGVEKSDTSHSGRILKPLPEAELLTGEENEDLKAKLKGVKLFKVKGSKLEDSFVGEIRLLEDKSTKARRLVFRHGVGEGKLELNARIPTLQVSNVLRWSYDVANRDLRIPQVREGVLYMYRLKPTSAQPERQYTATESHHARKDIFQEFAEEVQRSWNTE